MTGIKQLAAKVATYLEPEQVNQVRRAYFYAEQAHDGQFRRSGEAYVTHPLAVAGILADMRLDHHGLMAAMLHDVIEDTGIAKEAISQQFGETVAELVDGVSKLSKMDSRSKAEAQAENFQKMALAMSRDIRVILVKLADRLHNMRTLGVMPQEKVRRIARETLEFYAPIAARLGMHSIRVEFEDLGFTAMHPLRAARIGSAIENVRSKRDIRAAQIEQALGTCLAREGLVTSISRREKHLYSIYKKMRRKRAFTEIMDLYTFSILVDKVDTCYRALGAVHSLYKPLPGSFRDYIAIPKANGYQSLHTTLFGGHGVPIEIQIRTHEMEALASNGIAANWLYQSAGEGQHARARQWVKGLLELQQRAGNPLEFIESVKTDLFPDEVYLFTPKGRIMELPRGATAVDFAYAVHTDIGNRCIACRINRSLAPLSLPLESGATVEIVTAPNAAPNPNWLNFVVTGKARTHIRHALKQQRRGESVRLGQQLLDKALGSLGSALAQISAETLQEALAEYHHKNQEDLLEEIGLGNRMAYLVARRLTQSAGEPLPVSQGPLAICGAEGLSLSYGKCCTPIPGDAIVGYLSAGKGMVVHLEGCKNIAEFAHNPEKCLPLSWAKDVKGEFNVELRIILEHRRGLIALLASSVNAADANIEKISLDERDGRTGIAHLLVSVTDRVHLAQVIKRLRILKGVLRITRAKA